LLETIIIISAYCASRNTDKSDDKTFGGLIMKDSKRQSNPASTASKVGKTR